MTADMQENGHDFDFDTDVCTKCGMTRESFDDNTSHLAGERKLNPRARNQASIAHDYAKTNELLRLEPWRTGVNARSIIRIFDAVRQLARTTGLILFATAFLLAGCETDRLNDAEKETLPSAVFVGVLKDSTNRIWVLDLTTLRVDGDIISTWLGTTTNPAAAPFKVDCRDKKVDWAFGKKGDFWLGQNPKNPFEDAGWFTPQPGFPYWSELAAVADKLCGKPFSGGGGTIYRWAGSLGTEGDYYWSPSSVQMVSGAPMSVSVSLYFRKGAYSLLPDDTSGPNYAVLYLDCLNNKARTSAFGKWDRPSLGGSDTWGDMERTSAGAVIAHQLCNDSKTIEAAQQRALESRQPIGQEISSPSQYESTKPSADARFSFETAKTKCVELGFKPATEAYGKCVLQLSQ